MPSYTVRTTSPAGLYLPYYMKTGTYAGAINDAILGNGAIAGANVLFNCVGYSVGRLAECWNEMQGTTANPTNPFNIFAPYNAEDWYNVAVANNIPTGMTPQAGAVGVYYSAAQNVGHVCNLEQYVNGRWEISESHYYYDGNLNLYGSWDYSYLQSNMLPAFIGADPTWQLIGFIYPLGGVTPVVVGYGAAGVLAAIRNNTNRKRRGHLIII